MVAECRKVFSVPGAVKIFLLLRFGSFLARDEAAAAAPPLANLIGTLHHCLLGFPDIEHQT